MAGRSQALWQEQVLPLIRFSLALYGLTATITYIAGSQFNPTFLYIIYSTGGNEGHQAKYSPSIISRFLGVSIIWDSRAL